MFGMLRVRLPSVARRVSVRYLSTGVCAPFSLFYVCHCHTISCVTVVSLCSQQDVADAMTTSSSTMTNNIHQQITGRRRFYKHVGVKTVVGADGVEKVLLMGCVFP